MEVLDFDNSINQFINKNQIINEVEIFSKVINLHINNDLISITNLDVPRAGRFIRLNNDKDLKQIFRSYCQVKILNKKVYLNDIMLDFSKAKHYIPSFDNLILKANNLSIIKELLQTDQLTEGCINYLKGQPNNLIDTYLCKNISIFLQELHNHKIKETKLIGLGFGLTPSGDDFLYGFLLTLTLFNHQDYLIIKQYVMTNLNKTSFVSKQMFDNYQDGLYNELYYSIIQEINDGNNQTIKKMYKKLCDIGHSSGRDFLVGVYQAFVYLKE